MNEDGGESELIKIISKCRPETRDQFLLKLFDNDWNDYIVPEKSQIGGLKDYFPFQDILHTKSHQKTSVQNRVLLLLEENPSTSTFFDDNINGFNPPTLQPTLFDSPDDRTISSKRSNLFVDILNPQDNSTFNLGESVVVTINSIPQSENVTLFISNGYGRSKLVELSNTTTYTLPLDMDLTGTVSISALISDSEGNFEIDSVTVNVLPSQLIDSLSFINEEINIPLGQTFSLSVAGFLNEHVFEMNRFPQIQYTVDNPFIIKINSPGIIESLNLGSTFIKASFQGLEAFIKINVYDGFDWLNQPACTTPGTPTNISAKVSEDNSTLLSWTLGTPSGSPNVWYNWMVSRDSTADYGSGVVQGSTSDTEVSTNILPPGGKYYLRVNASTDCNYTSSDYGTSSSFKTSVSCITPGVPRNPVVSAADQNSVVLSWDPGDPNGSEEIIYYWVIDTNPNIVYPFGKKFGTSFETSVTTSGLEAGTTYYLRVYAYTTCDNSKSNYATSAAFTTDGTCITPNTPINVSAMPSGQNTAFLSWSSGIPAGSPTVSYFWVIGTNPNVTPGYGVDEGSTIGTTAFTSALACSTNYFLRVYARTDCNNSISAYGTSTAFTTSACSCITPGTPIGVNVSPNGQTSAYFSWVSGNPSGSPTVSYLWVVGTNPNVTYNNGIAQGSTNQTNASTSSLSPGTTYYLKVFSTTSCNFTNSAYSSPVPFTVGGICSSPAIQASHISTLSMHTQKLVIGWNNGSGSKRVVKINTVNQFSNMLNGTDPVANAHYAGQGEQVVYNGTGNTVTVTGLHPTSSYWFKVIEVSCDGSFTKYNNQNAIDNPKSLKTRIVVPSIQSLTATQAISGGVPFYTNTEIYENNPPIVIFADFSGQVRFALNASISDKWSFQLDNKQGQKVSDGKTHLNENLYGKLSLPQSITHNRMETVYTLPTEHSESPYLPLKLRLLFDEGLIGIDFPVHIYMALGALPVEYLRFNAEHNKSENTNELFWTTVREVNNDYFDIERSFERSDYENIGRVPGAGNSSSAIDYAFNDHKISQDGYYVYRLKQVDTDGRATYSNPAYVRVSRTQSVKTGIYPNPAADQINCYVDAYEGAKVRIEIYNSLGQILSQQTDDEIIVSGTLTRQLESKNFGKGIYTVVFTVDGIRYNHKLIIVE
jgi:hypothetical protein